LGCLAWHIGQRHQGLFRAAEQFRLQLQQQGKVGCVEIGFEQPFSVTSLRQQRVSQQAGKIRR
jgi:hypothetical protein